MGTVTFKGTGTVRGQVLVGVHVKLQVQVKVHSSQIQHFFSYPGGAAGGVGGGIWIGRRRRREAETEDVQGGHEIALEEFETRMAV